MNIDKISNKALQHESKERATFAQIMRQSSEAPYIVSLIFQKKKHFAWPISVMKRSKEAK